jgi:beta-lactam-binding protein with PASTA domain
LDDEWSESVRESVVTMWSGSAYPGMVRVGLIALLGATLGAAPSEPAEPSAAPSAGVQESEMPSVRGMQVDEAEEMLRAWRSDIDIRRRSGNAPPDANLGFGRVKRQATDDGESPSTVLYIVGQVPDLTGETRAGAERRLQEFGMTGTFEPADAPATSPVRGQDLAAGSWVPWLTLVTVELGPAPVPSTTRPARVQVRVPELIGLSVRAARTASADAGLTLALIPGSASGSDLITDQDPEAGRRVAPGSRISAEAAAGAVAVSPSRAVATAVAGTAVAGTPVAGKPGLEPDTTPSSMSEVLVKTGGSVLLLLLALLAVLGWAARAPKRASWVQVHVHAHPVGDVVGKHTTSAEDATPSRSVRVRAHVGPGRHTLEETSR